MAQSHDERMKRLARELGNEFLTSQKDFEFVAGFTDGDTTHETDEWVVVTVYKVKKRIIVSEAAGLTSRASVARCEKCGKPK